MEILGYLIIGVGVLIILMAALLCWTAIAWLFTRAWVEFKRMRTPGP